MASHTEEQPATAIKYNLFFSPKRCCMYLMHGEYCAWGYPDGTISEIHFSKTHELSSGYDEFVGTLEDLVSNQELPDFVREQIPLYVQVLTEKKTIHLEKQSKRLSAAEYMNVK